MGEKKEVEERASCKSERSVADGEAEMGMGCTRVVERVCSSLGLAGTAQTRFEPARDVANAGVLWAVPALLENGLLRHSNCFELASGFYGVLHVFVLLGLMALARVRTVEQLRYEDPGEWGKLVGLDRIPEVRTLRAKLGCMTADAKRVGAWSSSLTRDWMDGDCAAAGTLYVDGHMRAYWGKQTPLPRRYSSRQRLCLRGMMDYWVNDKQGLPFFVVQTPFSDGLLHMLEHEIVPRLLEQVPSQPTQQQLDADPLLARFTLVFDREGYSPDFLRRMWDKRIACVSYHKFPKGSWEEWEFVEQEVVLAHGVKAWMKLAERGTRLRNGFWVREIRKMSDSGHQVSVVCTNYRFCVALAGGHMFSRWSQENYFKYMLENFDLDRLAGYKLEPADETRKVVNPAYRQLESQIKTKAGKLTRKRAEFGQLTLDAQLEAQALARYETKKGELKEQIEQLEAQVEQLKQERKQTDRHLALAQLAEHERFALLAPVRKQFLDTIRMIAYRAESAMAMILRDKLARCDDARPLLREIYTTSADLLPDPKTKTLTIQLHHLTNRMSDGAVRCLAEELNASETLYPGTDLRMVFKLISDPDPGERQLAPPDSANQTDLSEHRDPNLGSNPDHRDQGL